MIPIQAMNEAASSGLMETQTFQEIFSQKTQEAAEEMLDELGAKMAGDVELVLEYQTVAPLLFERKALAHVRRKNPSLAGALPEVANLMEALEMARAEYMLDDEELGQLSEALKKPVE